MVELSRSPSGTGGRPKIEVADILRAQADDLAVSVVLTPAQKRVVRDIIRCRTAELGGHLERCNACGDERPAYNSCRNRHCPKCQALPQARWVARQMERVLRVTCFHVVFTLPAELRPIAKAHPREIYNLLFAAASRTLLALGREPKWLGAELGMTLVLHTWARDLSFHPHVHCIVTAGGLSPEGEWTDAASGFLFPVAAMAKLFRGKFLDGLCRLRREQGVATFLDTEAFDALVCKAYEQRWNVYSKAPFAGQKQIFEYLGQYTHRVGLSNHRLLAFDERGVTFRTRGDDTITLAPSEFIRRFVQHVLPKGFFKIRHYGLMANGRAVQKRERARDLLDARRTTDPDSISSRSLEAPTITPTSSELSARGWQEEFRELTGVDLSKCRACGQKAVMRLPLPSSPRLIPLAAARPRAPPLAKTVAA